MDATIPTFSDISFFLLIMDSHDCGKTKQKTVLKLLYILE